MSQYSKPDLEIIYFEEKNVITSSATGLVEGELEIKDDSNSANNLWGW